MKQELEVLKYCPNYQQVINYSFETDDYISEKLVRIYKDFIFKANLQDSKDLHMVKELDYVLGKYVDDFLFQKELRSEIVNIKIKRTCTDVLRAIVESVLHIFDHYLFNTTRKITIARWI